MTNKSNYNPTCPDMEPIVGEYVLGSSVNTDPYMLDFVIYAFALINSDGTLTVYSTKHLAELGNLRAFNPNLKVIMAIGGWGADGFSDAALTPTSRFAFAREVQKWVKEYNLDGIDLDWEYPGSGMAGIKSRPQDGENFTLLIEAIRTVLGENKWLSVAGIADSGYIRNVEIDKIAEYIDYFNVMTYDFTAGSQGSDGDKHQSNLYPSPLSLNNISVDTYVKNLINAGMPPEKILVGLPFYGRRGMATTVTFDSIRNNYINSGDYIIQWDNMAKAPYITDKNGNFVLSFDDEQSIYFKGQYVLDNCLGGLFSWQSNFDQANILARTMNYAVKEPDKLEEIIESYYV